MGNKGSLHSWVSAAGVDDGNSLQSGCLTAGVNSDGLRSWVFKAGIEGLRSWGFPAGVDDDGLRSHVPQQTLMMTACVPESSRQASSMMTACVSVSSRQAWTMTTACMPESSLHLMALFFTWTDDSRCTSVYYLTMTPSVISINNKSFNMVLCIIESRCCFLHLWRLFYIWQNLINLVNKYRGQSIENLKKVPYVLHFYLY